MTAPSNRPTPLLLVVTGLAVAGWGVLVGVWVYATVVSNVTPERLPRPIAPWLHVRTDTSGAAAFAGSILVFVAWQRLMARWSGASGVATAARSCVLYGMLAAAYTAAHAVTHPWLLPVQLTHLAPWPTEAQFGVGGLLVAALGAVLWSTAGRIRPAPDHHL